jgi:hypothetical protein
MRAPVVVATVATVASAMTSAVMFLVLTLSPVNRALGELAGRDARRPCEGQRDR